ncbi:hypothetical protein J4457_01845 [Candidatus Woesearchaeota archaeon]|nr:hypothetical protein [Candidatus Woesearchaeota archaeon]
MKRFWILLFILSFLFAAPVFSCDAATLFVDNQLLSLGERASFSLRISQKMNLTWEYWIEDSSGTFVKEKQVTHNPGRKSFTPKSIEGKVDYFVVKSIVEQGDCAYNLSGFIIVKNTFNETNATRATSAVTVQDKDVVLYQTSLKKAMQFLPWVFLLLATVLSLTVFLYREQP